MVATAVGMQVLGWRPFASTFAAFLSRAYDFIRMSAISRANYCLCGSHAGISIGEDGPSQMALEDIASLRAVHGSTVLYPCDANQTAKLVEKMADTDGIVYLRTLRPATPVALRRRRGVRDRRLADAARRATTSRSSAPGSPSTRRSRPRRRWRRRGSRRGSSTSTRSSRSTPRRCARSRVRSSRRRTTGPRAGSARRCSRRSATPTSVRRSSGSRCTRCRTRASRRSCSPRPASTPTGSRPPRGRSAQVRTS